MKRIISIMVLMCLVFSMAISAAAIDVKDSEKLMYSDEETGVDLLYRLVLPANYDPKYLFQLVVFFHGAGERGDDLEVASRLGYMRYVREYGAEYPFLFVAE